MADGYANHRKDLLPTFLVSKKTKWNGEKPRGGGASSSEFREVLRDRISSFHVNSFFNLSFLIFFFFYSFVSPISRKILSFG